MINTNTHTGPSFSLSNRIKRLTWNIVYVFLFRYSPRPFHAWRVALLRLFGAKLGKHIHIYPKARIWAPWNLVIADYAGIGDYANIYDQGLISIGKNAVISQGVHLCAGTHDYTKKGFPLITFPIHIGDDAWVAAEAFIHPGVTVHEGAVVGARAVVVKDVPSWKIVAGNPAQVIKDRKFETD